MSPNCFYAILLSKDVLLLNANPKASELACRKRFGSISLWDNQATTTETGINMRDTKKYDRILDALQQLLEDSTLQNISVNDIAKKAEMGKGSIYYYFPSKEAILDALIERNYEQPLKTAKNLAALTDISPFTRMAMILQACRSSSAAFLSRGSSGTDAQSTAQLQQKYMNHLISELKPALTEIITQGISSGEIRFDYPAALAEIVLIVLAVKLNPTFLSATAEDSEDTIRGLVSLLEKGTGVPQGVLNYLM